MKVTKPIALLALNAVLLTGTASAQIPLTGTNYTQTFAGLGAGLPPGWSVRTNAGANSLGANATFTAAATGWSSSSAQFAHYAATAGNEGTPFDGGESGTVQNAATNRCLGLRQTGTFGDPGAAFVLQLQNTLGFASFGLSLDCNMLYVLGRSTVWTVDYGLGTNPTSFTVLGTYADPGVFGATSRTFSFGSALNNLSQPVWIRIVALADSTGSGSRDTFGIDNFALSYGAYVLNTNPPVISAQPQSRTNNAGTTAALAVTATGEPPLYYQWKKGGADLADGGDVSGANTPALSLANVFAADAGVYSVVVTNSYGSALSSNATLVVSDPVIIAPPASRTNLAGDTASFSVDAVGTGPLRYQWLRHGTNLPGATASSLNVTNVQADDAGAYSVIVSNASSVVVSSAAELTLLPTPLTRLARWGFNATNSLSPSDPAPCAGSGAACLAGSVAGAFSYGTVSDPIGAPGRTNSGWNTAGYPSKTASNKTAGVQFHVSTLGCQNVLLAWEQRHTSSASRYARLQYSADGTNFTDADVITMNATDNSFMFYSSDLSGVPSINNNSNFAFRIVSEFESTAAGTTNTNYVPTDPAGSYSASGAIRFDLVSVYASPLGAVAPVPLSIRPEGNSVVLTWANPAFALEAAPQAAGGYTNVPGATSPHTNPATGAQKFFRLRTN